MMARLDMVGLVSLARELSEPFGCRMSCRTVPLRVARPLRGLYTLSCNDNLLWASRWSARDDPDYFPVYGVLRKRRAASAWDWSPPPALASWYCLIASLR